MEQVRFKRKTVTMEVLKSQQYKKRLRRVVFYVCVFGTVTLVFLLVAFAVFFKVRTIEIIGNSLYSEEEILSVLNVKPGDNLYSFNAGTEEYNIKKALPYINEINISRKIASSLIIELSETDEAMYLEIGGDYYLLSKELRVLSRTDNIDALGDMLEFKTNAVSRCIVGESLEFADTRSGRAITELYTTLEKYSLNTTVKLIDVTNRFDITLYYADSFVVYLGDIEYTEIKIQFLIGIIDRLAPTDTGKIDITNYKEAIVTLD